MQSEYEKIRNAAKDLLEVMDIWGLRSHIDLDKTVGSFFVLYNPPGMVVSSIAKTERNHDAFVILYALRSHPILLNLGPIILSYTLTGEEIPIMLKFEPDSKRSTIDMAFRKKVEGYTSVGNKDSFGNIVQSKEFDNWNITKIRKELTNLL